MQVSTPPRNLPEPNRDPSLHVASRDETGRSPAPLPSSSSPIGTSYAEGSIDDKKKNAPAVAASTEARMTRKRVADLASLNDSKSRPPESEDVAARPLSPKDQARESSSQHVCLCQPDPKIPRPRNAFILYRQNHHQNIVAQHPGLPNPEISKIAGQLWARESPAVKNEWKRLAEEEKVRHAQQYPDYRFQPRHKSRRVGSAVSLSSVDNLRCNKCGGRSIVGTGSLPSATPTRSNFSPSEHHSRKQSDNMSPGGSGWLPTPRTAGLSAPMGALEVDESAAKRRRINPMPTSPQGRYVDQHAGGHHRPSLPYPHNSPTLPSLRRESHPQPIQVPNATFVRHVDPAGRNVTVPISAGQSIAMGPPPPRNVPMPPTPHPNVTHHHQPPVRMSGQPHFESLRLPPLQSPNNDTTSPPTSIKAAIMNLSFMAKIKILRQISQPIAAQTPTMRKRGCVVAIEGDPGAPIDSIASALDVALNRLGEFDVQVLRGPAEPTAAASFGEYLNEVGRWHARVQEIMNFVTIQTGVGVGVAGQELSQHEARHHTRQFSKASSAHDRDSMDVDTPPAGNRRRSSSTSDNNLTAPTASRPGPHSRSPWLVRRASDVASNPEKQDSNNHNNNGGGGSSSSRGLAVSGLIVAQDQPSGYSAPRRDSAAGTGLAKFPPSQPDALGGEAGSSGGGGAIPVLLVPRYLVHASNAWASALPIADSYSTTDHWQWVATLWRGVPGPDYTVYVMTAGEAAAAAAAAGPKNMVEFKEELGTMVVRAEDAGPQQGRVVDVAAVRRVAFELGELARAVGGRGR